MQKMVRVDDWGAVGFPAKNIGREIDSECQKNTTVPKNLV